METLFTPFASFGGGLLIGLGAVLLGLCRALSSQRTGMSLRGAGPWSSA
jgi:hypothetical protein